ncbi:MAG: hypothetical protein ACLP6G_06805 [Terriglobales bacterium]
MADSLYLSLWFPDFDIEDMLPHALSVMRQFPFSAERPGINYVALHPVSWDEATILEQSFPRGIQPEAAVLLASDLLHEDYAYVFEAAWDLWMLGEQQEHWLLKPALVRFVARGEEFDEEAYRQEGHIQVDFGPDSPFLQEHVQLTQEAEMQVRANVQKLVEFTANVEKNSGTSGRLLWSESEENLAQRLIARLQRVE